ncbi:hypothetical protein K523DRAFT_369887 [Schizophyllum commune Tattone D]|nr:hypothetical protein K523DRAFT_369887 [Schizophyllum commune Tattone D]
MGTRRQVVPASLHSELTEYSSLIRALHTSSTLDVTSHLLPSAWKGKERATNYEDDEGDSEDEYVAPRTRSASRLSFERPSSAPLAFPSSPPSRSRSRSSAAKRRAPRESWTRWPLPQGDNYVPEWTWEDEVAAVASQLLTQSRPPAAPSLVSPLASELPETQPDHTRQSSQATVSTTIEETSSEDSDEDGNSAPTLPQSQSHPPATQEEDAEDSDTAEDEEPLPPAYLSALSQDSATFMSQVLALLAAHTPLRPGSLQNRIGTLTWRNVIDILSVSGFPGVDGSLLRNMTTKLEKVYDPYDGSERAAQRADMRLHARPPGTRTTMDPRPLSVSELLTQSTSASRPTRPTHDPLSELLHLPPMPPDWSLGAHTNVDASPPKLRKRKSQTQLEPKAMKRRRISSTGGRKVSMGRKASGAGKKVAVGKTKKKTAAAKIAMEVDGDEWQDEDGDVDEDEDDNTGDSAAASADAGATNEEDVPLPSSQPLPPSSQPVPPTSQPVPPTSQPLPSSSQPLPPPSPLPSRRRYPSTLPSLSPTQSSFPSLSQVLDQHRPPSADDSVRGRRTTNNSQPLPSPSTAAISLNSRASEEEVQNQLHLMDSDSDSEVPLARSPELPASRPARGRLTTAGQGASAVSSDAHAEGVSEASGMRSRAVTKKRITKKASTKKGMAKRLTQAAASTPPEAAAGTGSSSQTTAGPSSQTDGDNSSQATAASSSRTTRRTTRSSTNARSTSTLKGKRKPRIVSAAVIEDSGSE